MSDPRVTILIPSHLRPALLGRALEHYASSGLSVIVADSSHAPFARTGEFERLRYLHPPRAATRPSSPGVLADSYNGL